MVKILCIIWLKCLSSPPFCGYFIKTTQFAQHFFIILYNNWCIQHNRRFNIILAPERHWCFFFSFVLTIIYFSFSITSLFMETGYKTKRSTVCSSYMKCNLYVLDYLFACFVRSLSTGISLQHSALQMKICSILYGYLFGIGLFFFKSLFVSWYIALFVSFCSLYSIQFNTSWMHIDPLNVQKVSFGLQINRFSTSFGTRIHHLMTYLYVLKWRQIEELESFKVLNSKLNTKSIIFSHE